MLWDLDASKLKMGLSARGRGGVSRGIFGVEQAEDFSTMQRLPSSSVSSVEDVEVVRSLQFTTDNLPMGSTVTPETGCGRVWEGSCGRGVDVASVVWRK